MIVYYKFLWESLIIKLLQLIKVWVKPVTLSVYAGTLTDLTRSHTDLIVENALLRQPLIVLNRLTKRPQLTHFDRFQLHSIVYFLRVMLRSFTCHIKLPTPNRFQD